MKNTISLGETKIHSEIREYNIKLRNSFGTSHSKTTQRTNAFIKFSINEVYGISEVGLPPKKSGIYLADFEEVKNFFLIYIEELIKFSKDENNEKYYDYDPFIKGRYFNSIREDKSIESRVLRICFYVLDNLTPKDVEYRNASICGIECALLDLWSRLKKKSLYELIGIDGDKPKCPFYTVGLDEIEKMIISSDFGLKYTPYLKIKLDNQLENSILILEKLYEHRKKIDENLVNGKYWSIDANSAWTPENTIKFYNQILSKEEFKNLIYMVEQPFPADILNTNFQVEQWRSIKNLYSESGVFIYADESACTFKDIPQLQPLVHGVNIKLEKTGGIRQALVAFERAKEFNLLLWIGMMVGSNLSSSTAACLFPLTDFGGDLDGCLLVEDESSLIEGGIQFDKNSLFILSSPKNSSFQKYGVLCNSKI